MTSCTKFMTLILLCRHMCLLDGAGSVIRYASSRTLLALASDPDNTVVVVHSISETGTSLHSSFYTLISALLE
jgi:hypothetical protein